MAEVNVKALRDFQKMWGPVLETIPAVMDAVRSQQDLDRAIASKKKELADVEAEIDKKVSEANLELARLSEKAQNARDEKSAVQAQIASDIAAQKDAVKEATKRAKATLESVQAKLEEAQSRLDNISVEIAGNLKAAKAEQDAMVAQKQSEISDLEKKRVSAEKALESIRAKLG